MATLQQAQQHDRRPAGVAAALFLCLFAAQAALIALAPVLASVARDFSVSTAAAGQLRTVAGLAAGITALWIGRASSRIGLRDLLLAGAALLAAASLASAVAPTFALLAAAQLLVGAAAAALVTGGTTAVAEWAAPEQRSRVLSWMLTGPPAAWIVGMPLIGYLGQASWRYAWVALPFTAALLAAVVLLRRPRSTPAPRRGGLGPALRDPEIARWAAGELLAIAAWLGTLVYAGALFTESYGTSLTVTGGVLAAGAAAYAAGNLAARRAVERDPRRVLVRAALGLAAAVVLFGVLRLGVAVSAGLFATAAALAGARTLAGNAAGLAVAPERRMGAMSARSAVNQFGYFIGSAVAGAALAAFGYAGVGVAAGVLLVAAAAALVRNPLPLPVVRRIGITQV